MYYSPLTEKWQKQFDPIKIDCCVECNGALERNFELPGQAAAIRVLKNAQSVVSESEFAGLSAWLVKTWLLLTHPNSTHQDSTPAPPPWPIELFDWMIDRPDQPPPGMQMWVFGYPFKQSLEQTSHTGVVFLPPGALSLEWSYARIKGLLTYSAEQPFDTTAIEARNLTQVLPFTTRTPIVTFSYEPVALLHC